MARVGDCARIDTIATELRVRGMACDAASEVGRALVLAYPLVRRCGVGAFAHTLALRGLAAADARDTAATLLALELYDAGCTFGRVLDEMLRREVAEPEARAAAYEGARLRRAICGSATRLRPQAPATPPTRPLSLRRTR